MASDHRGDDRESEHAPYGDDFLNRMIDAERKLMDRISSFFRGDDAPMTAAEAEADDAARLEEARRYDAADRWLDSVKGNSDDPDAQPVSRGPGIEDPPRHRLEDQPRRFRGDDRHGSDVPGETPVPSAHPPVETPPVHPAPSAGSSVPPPAAPPGAEHAPVAGENLVESRSSLPVGGDAAGEWGRNWSDAEPIGNDSATLLDPVTGSDALPDPASALPPPDPVTEDPPGEEFIC